MSFVYMTLLFLLNAILMGKFGRILGQNTCDSNSDCGSYYSNIVCCRGYGSSSGRQCYHGSRCVGLYCTTDGDCGGKEECCISNRCTKSGCTNCYSNSYCGLFEYCCKQQYLDHTHVCRRSCVGESCHSSSDCGGLSEYCNINNKCVECSTDGDCSGSKCCLYNKCVTSGCTRCSSNSGCSSSEYCCKRGIYVNVCRKNCVGETCSYDSDCGGPGESCDSSSKKCVVPTSCSTDGDCSGSECCLNSKCVTSGCTRCSSNYGCSSSEYCCKRGGYVNVCRKNCVGEKCSYDSDCGGPEESCDSSSNKCVVPTSCFTDGDCSGNECCLNSKCVTSNCTRCSSNSECSSSEYCCKRRSYVNVCRKNCVGETCSYDSDCGGPGERCHSSKCKRSSYSSTTASWVVPVIVVGVILFIIVFGGIPAYRCYRGSSQRGRVVRPRPAQNAIAIVAIEKTQVHTSAPPPAVCNAPPPPYYNRGGDFPSAQPNQFPPPQPLHFPEPQPPQY